MNYNDEVWKDIPGFENVYQISTLGRLKSFKQYQEGIVLKQTNDKGGYFSVVLSFDGKVRYTRIHRLVAEAFIPNPEGYNEVNHMDSNKQNNHVDNLEWCDRKHNAKHARDNNPNIIAKMNLHNQYIKPRAILQFDKHGNRVGWFISAQDAGRHTGICARNILQVANGDRNECGYLRKSAGGYVWKFESEVI